MQTTLNPSEISELIRNRVEELNISAETRNEGTPARPRRRHAG
jgi:F-type H+-transporting ATPase subunit alpha